MHFPAEQSQVVRTLIERITIRLDGLEMKWRDQGLADLLALQQPLARWKEAA